MNHFHSDNSGQPGGLGVEIQYGRKLLLDVNAPFTIHEKTTHLHPAHRWAESGLMSLTGNPEADSKPVICPVPLVGCADGALLAFDALSGFSQTAPLDAARLLTERAAIVGYQCKGSISLGGSCRMISTRDGKIAVNLARASDWNQLPAWLQSDVESDWLSVATQAAQRTTDSLLNQGRLLGLAVANARPASIPASPVYPKPVSSEPIDHSATRRQDWFKLAHRGPCKKPVKTAPTVVDLSSLWAGPLCSHLWHLAGATVIKVESSTRPDGARRGSADFYNLLNCGKKSVCLDLSSPGGQRQLINLIIKEADIVIEGSRPRALRQMAIYAEQLIDQKPGLTWMGTSAYGRQEPQGNWIGYGDDTAVAAGLSSILQGVNGAWLFCGDAIADPLTGLHAAVAGWAYWQKGGGVLIDLSLNQTVRHCIGATAPANGDYPARAANWQTYLQRNSLGASKPKARMATQTAATLGADNYLYCHS